MINGLHLYSTILTSGHSKRFTISHCVHAHMHTRQLRGQPCKATASSTGAVRVRCLAGIPWHATQPANPYLLSHMPPKNILYIDEYHAIWWLFSSNVSQWASAYAFLCMASAIENGMSIPGMVSALLDQLSCFFMCYLIEVLWFCSVGYRTEQPWPDWAVY